MLDIDVDLGFVRPTTRGLCWRGGDFGEVASAEVVLIPETGWATVAARLLEDVGESHLGRVSTLWEDLLVKSLDSNTARSLGCRVLSASVGSDVVDLGF